MEDQPALGPRGGLWLELPRASEGTLSPDAFAVVSTHQPALGPRGGLGPVLLMCNP
jgi:hypothetical protein